MQTVYKDQRIGIFLDVQNLYHSAKNLYHGKVNYRELIKELTAGRHLIRAMAYVVKSEATPVAEEKAFFEAL
ncbi:MAG: NYN domain-containing protein, partial [Patescibacteria group bacterium]